MRCDAQKHHHPAAPLSRLHLRGELTGSRQTERKEVAVETRREYSLSLTLARPALTGVTGADWR